MDNFIKVYYVDANGVYQGHFRLEKEGYQAKTGETTVAKPSLREPMVIEGGTWRGATDAEYNAWLQAHPQQKEKPAGPSAEQQMIATLGQQQAKTDANVKQMQQMIAMLGSQMASSDAKEKANGGN